jgi:hypothetical protein
MGTESQSTTGIPEDPSPDTGTNQKHFIAATADLWTDPRAPVVHLTLDVAIRQEKAEEWSADGSLPTRIQEALNEAIRLAKEKVKHGVPEAGD